MKFNFYLLSINQCLLLVYMKVVCNMFIIICQETFSENHIAFT